MSVQYRVKVPFIDDMGSISPFIATQSYMETAYKNALWTVNKMRDHDGLKHLDRLPPGTTFEAMTHY